MGRVTIFGAALLIGLILGVVSAINALGAMGLQPIAASPRWSEWRLGERDNLLIYSLGHFLSEGQLPPPKSSQFFVRSVDEDGNGLRADCVYTVEGQVTVARWWTLSIAPSGVTAAHSELSAGEAVVGQGGDLRVTISARPMPGNWIAPADTSALLLRYTINEAAPGETVSLPTVTKSGC